MNEIVFDRLVSLFLKKQSTILYSILGSGSFRKGICVLPTQELSKRREEQTRTFLLYLRKNKQTKHALDYFAESSQSSSLLLLSSKAHPIKKDGFYRG